MKKRIVSLIMIVLITLSLLAVSGCANTQERVVFSTGGTTGVYYIFGGEISSLWINKIPNLDVTVESSGGSKDNVLALYNGEADIAWVQNDVMSYAFDGEDFFDNTVADNFSAIAAVYPEVVQLVVAKDSGITCIEDLRGKNISVGPVGSGHYFNALQILDLYGMTVKDIKPQYLNNSEVIESFQNKQIDAFFLTAAYPHASVVDVSLKRPIDIISFSEDEIAQLQSKYGFYVTDTIPAGTYEGVDEDKLAPAVAAVLVARNDVKEDVVYQLTKTLFENCDELTNAKKAYIDINNAVVGIPTSAKDKESGVNGSFHPGVLKYYNERGILAE